MSNPNQHNTPITIGYEAKRIYHNTTGLGNYSRDLIRILSAYYPERKYFLYNPKSPNKVNFTVPNPNVVAKTPQGFWKQFKNLWRQYRIVADLKRDQIDLFHGLSGELPIGLQKNGIKSVVTIHDLIFLKFPQFYGWFDRKMHYYKFKKAAHQADQIIAISEQTKQDIITYLNVPSDKIKVLYQGCSNVFKQEFDIAQKESVTQKYKLPTQFVLNVGTIETRKNIFEVVKALKGTSIPLVIVGKKTAYAQKIEDFVAAHQMENQILFLTGLRLEELAIVYQLATVFIYPSLYEGFGIPIIEALYSKTPVITSKVSCLPEAGGPDSVYIDPLDTQNIQDALLEIWNNPEKRHEMSEKGHIFVQKFNDEVIASEMNALYLNVLNRTL